MINLPDVVSPDRWIVQLFSAKSAAEGAILRRKVTDVERLVGRDRFLHGVRRRGFHCAENTRQFVIFCNREPMQVLR